MLSSLRDYRCGPNSRWDGRVCLPLKSPPKVGGKYDPPAPNEIINVETGEVRPYTAMEAAASSIGLSDVDQFVVLSFFNWAELPPGHVNNKSFFKTFAGHVKRAKKLQGKNYDPLMPINAVLRKLDNTPLFQLPFPANKLRPKAMQGLAGMGCGSCAATPPIPLRGMGEGTPVKIPVEVQIKSISDTIFGTAANAMKTYFEYQTLRKKMKNGGMSVNEAAQETYQETFFTGRNIGIIGGIAVAGLVLYLVMKKRR